ncbi:FAD-binding and (Fe-S)-binding domain-containing protein [Streptomyces gobiensis]|uniref:FAD-binding and (Fe-S)-binding domain-containing protein n=1 Tax=Streptomyces gobiensis TaxID=2875706 RepID=UPI001E2BBB04|nr:FAD-binding and (Fe-S)-binding domain-containing protein [Streptomyces gobiensis]UGY91824.1 FAD-binding oxidoreductase [Streptomyces gobiensis]
MAHKARSVTVPARTDTRFPGGMAATEKINVKGLQERLRRHVEGEVRFDDGSRALYATDASNFRQEPIGVVIPRTMADVTATVAACHAYGAPVLSRGCGTSLSGETVNFAVVMDFSKHLTAVEGIDARKRLAHCEPGAVCDDLKRAAAEHGLTWGPDPSTHAYCTVGGMLGNNSCGAHSVMSQFRGGGPRTSDNVEEMEVLTYDGLRLTVGPTSERELARIIDAGGRRAEIYRGLRDLRNTYADVIRERMPDIPRRVSGYNLDELLPENGFNVARALVGTEGTCVTVLNATLRLMPQSAHITTLVLGYDDIFTAADRTAAVMDHEPLACEAMDEVLVNNLRRESSPMAELELLPPAAAWLLIEVDGDSPAEAEARAERLLTDRRITDRLRDVRRYADPAEAERVWRIREGGLGATAFPPDGPDHWPGWEDSAVPPARVGDYLRDLKELYARHGLEGAVYGHFGQGCVHSRISFDLYTADGIATYRRFLEQAADLATSYGGSLSGEHGDGQQRAELLPRMYGEELVAAFREFKRIWDPLWKMNPGKVVDAYRLDEHLRLGTDYHPSQPDTYFSYPEDNGSLAHAALRCVGVGKCREPHGEGTMCPSFQVLHEEKHTTRGRARLFSEMLEGDISQGGWRDEDLHDALDLCLSCKGCTHECPVAVDIPTLKAEFLAHYYAGRLRPRAAYAMGWIMYAARLASLAPSVANFATQTPLLSHAVKLTGGVAMKRRVPAFAATPFHRWFAGHRPANPGGKPVLLWPDTFNNYFKPETAIAAVRVLEDAGFRVTLPRSSRVCCGRPLYDYGFLGMAERFLRHTLDVLRPALRQGVPVVGIEPSCLAVFRDELPKLMPHDADARRLTALAVQFSELLDRDAPDWRPPRLDSTALVHGHCHHKNSPGGIEAELRLLDRAGLDYALPDTGCCGMAGAFGFEHGERYDVSVAAGERVLLPAVRDAPDTTLLIANGFSCKEQISQQTERRALHIAEALALALDGPASSGPTSLGPRPERLIPDMTASPWRGAGAALTATAALTLATAARRARRG